MSEDRSETTLLSAGRDSRTDGTAPESESAVVDTLPLTSDDGGHRSSVVPEEGEKEEVAQGSVQRSKWLSLPYLQSYVYFSLYISLGLTVGSTGPTLELLALNTNSTTDEVGTIFTARGIGWLGGSLLAGTFNIFELEWISSHRLMLISAATLSVYSFLVPLVRNLWLLLIVALISSVSCSWIDVGANALLFAVWKEKVGPWMQALHFFFGIGASVAPAIIAFIMKWFSQDRQLLVASYTIGILALCAAMLPLFVSSPRIGKQQEGDGDKKVQGQTLSKRREMLLVFMTSLFLFVYVGIESSYGGWIFTYARENFPTMPEWEAASLASAFWFAITAGRLLAVLLTVLMPNRTLLLVDLLVCLPAGILLVSFNLFTFLRLRVLLWGVTFLYGIGMASVFATAFSLPSEQGLEITSSASSWFIVGGSSGDMAVPAALGFLIVRWPSALSWAVLIAALVLLGLYAALVLSMHHWTKSEKERDEQRAALAAPEVPEGNDL